MPYYYAAEMEILVEGAQPQCLTGFSLSETIDLVDSIGSQGAWKDYKANIQGYQITLQGNNQGAYAVLRALKRSRTQITWTIRTPDLNINQTGEGFIVSLERGHSPSADQTFNVTISGQDGITTL